MNKYYNIVTILYVEDEPNIREETSYILNKMAKKLYIACNGEEGLKLYKQYNPDIVITDIKMPKMSGIDMAQAIKNINNEQPIIVTTAFSESGYLLEAIELQLSGYILKPVDKKILKNKIIELIKNILLKEELKQKDIQLLEVHKMASLGEMIGNIAHQWRQPLNAIAAVNMKVETMLDMGQTITYETYKPISAKINDQLQFLSVTIDTFKNYIKEKKEYKELVIQDRIDKTLNIIETSLYSNNIKLIKVIDYTKPIKKDMVVGELNQVLINIINNAKDILVLADIEEKWIKLTLTKQNNNATITIEDNGGGVPSEIINMIFDPYFTTNHKNAGTGLGLYMSYKIITESLHGKIYVQNSEYGAKFFIELPLSKSD